MPGRRLNADQEAADATYERDIWCDETGKYCGSSRLPGKEKMEFEHDGEKHNVELLDDGTLDTVISVDGHEVRFSQEHAADFRDQDGVMTDSGLIELARDALDLGLDEES
jgi:hypothetical protein